MQASFKLLFECQNALALTYSGALCKFHVIEGQNEHDQIVLYALHSFLVKIQIKAGYVRTKQA